MILPRSETRKWKYLSEWYETKTPLKWKTYFKTSIKKQNVKNPKEEEKKEEKKSKSKEEKKKKERRKKGGLGDGGDDKVVVKGECSLPEASYRVILLVLSVLSYVC